MLRITRKRVVGTTSALTVLVASILVGATMAWASGPVVHHVSVGTPDACVALGFEHPGCDANFSLVANQDADGDVSGQYSDRFANGDGFHAVVDCLVVIGNDAWISGVITQGRIDGIDLAGLEVPARVGTTAPLRTIPRTDSVSRSSTPNSRSAPSSPISRCLTLRKDR